MGPGGQRVKPGRQAWSGRVRWGSLTGGAGCRAIGLGDERAPAGEGLGRQGGDGPRGERGSAGWAQKGIGLFGLG